MDKNRKFQWICLIFVISQHTVICQKLTEKENLMRLKDCGKQFLPHPSENENGVEFNYTNLTSGWLLWTSQILPKENLSYDYIQSAAFPISNRHVFTSSQLVLNKDKKWAVDGAEFKECNNGQADLPDNVAKNLTVSLAKNKSIKVLRGRMFDCNRGDFPTMYTPLLLETEPLDLTSIPCLADESDIKIGAEVHAYGLDGGVMKHHNITVDVYTKDLTEGTWVYTRPPYRAASDRGGPLVMNVNGKATVIGLKASPATDNSKGNYFFSMPKLRDEICEYSGVCFVKNFTEALAKISTTEAPVTKAPEDSGTPRRPSPDAHEPKERKRPTYSEGVEPEESGSDEDEEDTDILLSKDFFTGVTRRKNLNIFIIVFVFVFLYTTTSTLQPLYKAAYNHAIFLIPFDGKTAARLKSRGLSEKTSDELEKIYKEYQKEKSDKAYYRYEDLRKKLVRSMSAADRKIYRGYTGQGDNGNGWNY
ncbi:hypothetical protein GCK72_012549 [Caenorhabditis remanei]|uniref:Uncharacterized protein n=1 Tax=Caenorhabditis remanei TaxID=31234 RepID=A0A6A5GNG8_CAERE|nr:hypothetical protein GCK72_012549 [Caenorhabditis remanei]KAF1756096.1 hypothetical protein GCK72_012549 [Caenorhabditis remanei]